jgi:anaerobic selenocysteine-containing dehydrogenase
MSVSRREFLKISGTSAAAVTAGSLFSGQLRTLVPAKGKLTLGEEFIPTTCWIGKQDCGMHARVVNGRIISFSGHPAHPRNKGTLCPKGVAQIQSIYDPNRVKTPLRRTNEKGIPGTWEQISWEEALDTVADRIKDVLERDPRLFVWQKGRSKAKDFYDDAFVKATGATKLHHGAFCSDAGYRALEYTIGMHGVLHPDMRNTNYLLSWGWNITNAGGNKFCWLTWPQQLVEAKERGMKVVALDPRRRGPAHFADEWLAVKPGTDLAMALALCHLLVKQDSIDHEYLRKYTNSPFLVDSDGMFLLSDPVEGEEDGKPLVWDTLSNAAVPHDSEGIAPALDGYYTVGSARVPTGFQIFKESLEENTAEWAGEICGVPAEQIEQVARELAEHAMIGSTIEIDGKTLPYRPVAIMAYHMSQQELGFQALRAMLFIPMLLGSVGAVGGQFSDFTWKEYKNWKKFENISVNEGPYNIYLAGSKYYPINSNNSSIVAKVMNDPDEYEVDYVPEVFLLHHVNPLGSFTDREENIEAYKKIDFVAAIDPWLSLTADLFADIVMPAATIEKYEGPMNATDQYVDAVAMRIPPVDPLFQSRGEIDIYMDLCEKIGVLYGEGGYLEVVNKELKLVDTDYALPLNTKPTPREIFDNYSKKNGLSGIDFFETAGVQVKGPVDPAKFYPYAMETPFGGILPHRLYGESLLVAQQEMQALGADEIYWRDYTALPTWRDLTVESSPPEYDFLLMSTHLIEFKQSRTPIPMMVEMVPNQVVEINTSDAKAKGIADGDEVMVESIHALTGETRALKTIARCLENIRPGVVCMPHHFGEYVKHPWIKGTGPSPNSLFFTGEGYVANTADQTFLVKVKVSKV